MMNLPYAMITARKLVELETHSARPGAPVQASTATVTAHPRTRRTRSALASALHRAANVVAPAA
jgi:hypothetical protein